MPPRVIAQGPTPSRAASIGSALGGGIGQGVGALAGDWLGNRRLSRQLNPMREALLAQMQQNPLQAPTTQQQMIMAAAQDPKQFARLAGSQQGALDLGSQVSAQPRVRDIVVHAGDELNNTLKLGLNGQESAVVQLGYDQNDTRLPGFTVRNYNSSRDNQTGSSAGLGEIVEINRARERDGKPLMTAEETEQYLGSRRQTARTLQEYNLFKQQQIERGVADANVPSFEEWAPSFTSQQGVARASADVVSDRLGKLEEDATAAQRNLQTVETALNLIDRGIVAGTAAESRLSLARALDTVLGRETDTTTADTDAYIANAGRLVGQTIRLFGAGTGLSDADRQYARQISGGEITMTPEALRKVLNLMAKANIGQINLYNERLSGLGDTYQTLGSLYEPLVVPQIGGSQQQQQQQPWTPGPNDVVIDYDAQGNRVQ